jgi:hypothetical protein
MDEGDVTTGSWRHCWLRSADRLVRTSRPTTHKGGSAVRRTSLTLLYLLPVMAAAELLASCSSPQDPQVRRGL